MESKPVQGWGILSRTRFAGLGMAVFLDSIVQAVVLTFLAFVLLEKGADTALASASVVIVLVGGMAGKFVCGHMAARFGDRMTFVILQVLTVIGIVLLVILPVTWLLLVLPLIGLAVQGSSTVTYGSVSDLVSLDRHSRGYALIYTISSSSSVAGPFLFGLLADGIGLDSALYAPALVAAVTLPFSVVLSGSPSSQAAASQA